MPSARIATGAPQQIRPRLVSSALLVAALISVRTAFAEDEATLDNAALPVLQPTPRAADNADDVFVPINKVVPRAKIVLREKQRLPDLGGDKTFASAGTLIANPQWIDRTPPVPWYPFAYNPIYFEDLNLERCGLSCGCCVQPVVSGLHFFGSVAILPIKVLIAPPCSCIYPPGECLPGYRFNCFENFFGPVPGRARAP